MSLLAMLIATLEHSGINLIALILTPVHRNVQLMVLTLMTCKTHMVLLQTVTL
jgi:hypothetical protein